MKVLEIIGFFNEFNESAIKEITDRKLYLIDSHDENKEISEHLELIYTYIENY